MITTAYHSPWPNPSSHGLWSGFFTVKLLFRWKNHQQLAKQSQLTRAIPCTTRRNTKTKQLCQERPGAKTAH